MLVTHGWSDSRLPFIFAAASLQTKHIASAISSAAVKVRNSFSGFSSRIRGVTIALTTITFAVAAVSLNESARARVQLSAAALAAAYEALVASGCCACEEDTRMKRPWVLSARASQNARVVYWTVRTKRSCSQS